MLFLGVCLRCDMFLWNQQYMGRRLGIYVGEAEAEVVLVDVFRGDRAGDDLAEEAIGTHIRNGRTIEDRMPAPRDDGIQSF